MEHQFNELEETPTEQLQEIKSDVINTNEITGNTTSGILVDNNNFNNQNEQPRQTIKIGNLLNAEMAVGFIDIIIPVVFVLAFKKIHNKTISKKQIQLTSSEKDTIKPVLQNYLDSVNVSIENPLNALIITVGFIYGMKYVEIQNELPNGKFANTNENNIGEPTAQGTIKRDGRGRPKGSIKKPKAI